MVGYKLINAITENGSVKRRGYNVDNEMLVKLIENKIEKENDKYVVYSIEN